MIIKIFKHKITIKIEKISNKKPRQTKSKQKIIDAINVLKKQNKNITNYAIQKQSKLSINTIKKYKNVIEEYK